MNRHVQSCEGWGRYPRADCPVVEPDGVVSLPTDYVSCIARGMGRSYGDASFGDAGTLVVKTRWMDKLIAFDRVHGCIEAQAGILLQDLLDVIIPAGWFIPVTPGTRFVSLGGMIASNVHGKNHHRYGSIVHCVQSVDLLTERGVVTCARDQHADLFFATVGGYGLTGIILSARLQLRKIDSAWILSRSIKIPDLEAVFQASDDLDEGYEYSVTWLDTLAKGKSLGRSCVMLGRHMAADELTGEKRDYPLRNRWKRSWVLPDIFPDGMLNRWSNHLFNFAYGHKQWVKERWSLASFESWFYPLDAIHHWNRLYGKNGFAQYQFSVPHAQAFDAVKEVLLFLQKRGLGSFLTVLKRISHDAVTLPFCLPGYTLAMDFSLRHSTIFTELTTLDRIVLSHGGRVYLTKDARLSAETFRAMYPEYPAWRNVVDQYAPKRRFVSQMAQRLKL